MSNYVTDGLMLYLDALWNLGKNIHNSTTNNWKDLSNNDSDSLCHSCTWSNDSLIFNGQSSWVNCGQHNYPYITLEVVVKFNSIGDETEECNAVAGNWQSSGYGIQQKNAKHSVNFGINNTWYSLYGSTPIVGEKITLTATYDGSTAKFYENGILVASENVQGTIKPPSDSTVFALGTNPKGSSSATTFLNGDIYSVRLYNRALSEDEVMQNYNDYIDHSLITKYLIKSENILYTVIDKTLTQIEDVDINASIFREKGFDALPNWELINALKNPEILKWYNHNMDISGISADMIATPLHQNIISEPINLVDDTILGIESVIITCEGNPLFAISFDKITWKAWDGENWIVLSEDFSGMSKEIFEAITVDNWKTLLTNSTEMFIRISLTNTNQIIHKIDVDFLN